MAIFRARRGIDPNLSPEEREARIAELRARRRKRARVLALRSGIVVGVLGLLAVGLVYWLLMTLGGRDFLLAQISARLPPGTTFEWRAAEGPATGPLTLYDVRFVYQACPDRDEEPVPFGDCDEPLTLSFEAGRVMLDPDIRPLFGRLLRLDALEIDDARLTLPPSADDEPFELPTWPDVLPQIGPLPLAMQADAIRIQRFEVVGADGPIIDVRSATGALDARDGQLRVDNLVVDSDLGRFAVNGEYLPDDDYRMDLVASAVLPAPPGRTRPRFGLVARGDVTELAVAIRGNAPAPVRADLTLRGRDRPGWRLAAEAQALDLALLTGNGEVGGDPLRLALTADGQGGEARLEGWVEQGELRADIRPSVVRLEDQVIEFKPLRVDVLDGRISLRGHADFTDPEQPRGKLALAARDVQWRGSPDEATGELPVPITADADLGLAGNLAAWAVIGKASVTRETQTAQIELDGRGDDARMVLRTLRASMPEGQLDGRGEVSWAPSLAWTFDAELAGFDPGYFVPDWPGRIEGTLASTGSTREADGGLDITVDAPRLAGTLRGRRLDGRAQAEIRGPAADAAPETPSDIEGEVDLRLGQSRVEARGQLTDRIALDANLQPLQLDDFVPGAQGRLQGRVQLSGTRDAPDIEADLSGNGLRWGDYGAERIALQGRLPWGRSDGGRLTLTAEAVEAGMALDSVNVTASGAIESLQATASVRGDIGALDLEARLQQAAQGWRGALSSLQLAPARGAAWSLQSPATFAQNGDNWRVDESCFASSDGGSLCVAADWPRGGVTARGTQLPLALAEPYLPEREDGTPWALRGEIALDAQVRPVGNGYAGNVDVRSSEGGLRFSPRAPRDVVSYSDLALQAEFDGNSLQGTLSTGVDDTGRIRAEIRTGWDDYAPLAGSLDADIDNLTWLELFSPDIVEPEGTLVARLTLGGTRAEPQIGGQANLTGFRTEIPSLAIVLTDGNLRLDAAPDGSARLDGSLRSGEGTLDIDGTLGWSGEQVPIVINVRGEDVLVSDTRDLHAVANPELTVRIAPAQPIDVSGTVTIPTARLDLERLSEGVSASPDVVVLDPVDPEQGPPTGLRLDVTAVLGEDVDLNGFGLTGKLGGRLRVRQVPGREIMGQGMLTAGGRYSAYGQELRITRGEFTWSNDPIADPVINLRAERRIEAEELTAGIDVTGRVSSPSVNVWTDPSRDQSEALAYLALGRSLSTVTGAEGDQLDAAGAALSAGGGMLASQLGSRMGLDNAGIGESRALGGSVLGVGKQLSPRLYVGFGVSLLGTGQVLTLKYLLTRGFDVEIESSTLENRGSLNWRRERD